MEKDTTVFLELLSSEYCKLIDALCLAMNSIGHMAQIEKDEEDKKALTKEFEELEALSYKIGEQAFGQLPMED